MDFFETRVTVYSRNTSQEIDSTTEETESFKLTINDDNETTIIKNPCTFDDVNLPKRKSVRGFPVLENNRIPFLENYSDLLPKIEKKVKKIFVFGELGVGKSTLINYYKFGDLEITLNSFGRFQMDVSNEENEKLKGNCVIFHKMFANYVGEGVENVRKDHKYLYEVHQFIDSDLRITPIENNIDIAFNGYFLNDPEEMSLEILLPAFGIETSLYKRTFLYFANLVDILIKKIMDLNPQKFEYAQILKQIKCIINKAEFSQDRNWLKKRFKDFQTDFLSKSFIRLENYDLIINHFLEHEEQCFFMFKGDKEGSFNERVSEKENEKINEQFISF